MRPAAARALGSNPDNIKGVEVAKGTTRRALELARPYRWMIGGYLGIIVLEALLDLVPPLVFRQIIDTAIPHADRGLLNVLAVVVVVVALASGLLSFGERFWSARIGEGLIYDLRVKLFDHVQRLPIAFFTRTQTGALISRMNNDVIGAQRAVTTTLGSVVSNVVVLGTTLVAMLLLEARLTILALIMLPIFIIPAKRVGRRMQTLTREGFDENSHMNTTMTERFNVAGAMLVKLFGRYDHESAEFSRRAGRVRDIGVKSAMYGRTFYIALGLVAAVGTAVVYWLGGQLVISGALTLGTLVAMAAYVTRIYAPLTSLTNARIDIMTALVSFHRVFEVVDTHNALPDRPDAIELVDPDGRVELDGVVFHYPVGADTGLASLELTLAEADAAPDVDDDTAAAAAANGRSAVPVDVLHGIDLDIAPGSLVAVVGPSGAGKSTLCSLVPRLYDVSAGAVRVDGHDVRDLTQDSLHAAIGVVMQDPHLFHESVEDNLRYARRDATADEIEAACRAAQIHDVIVNLPDGYRTIVGERGYRLSGGEKQRLAIARMLLKDPAIVVLDEATSHLDSENEAAVQRALAESLRGRTSIVIAHRLSTITAADLIVVMDGGRIVERGGHQDLLDLGGLYAELYRTLVRTGDDGARVIG
jgi:ATP-binding cassette subfamily B protein